MANPSKKERADERKALHIMSTVSRMWLLEMPADRKRDHLLESLLTGEDPFPYDILGFEKGTAKYEMAAFVYRHYWSKGMTTTEIYEKWTKIEFNKRAERKDWNKMPKEERKDNQNPSTNTINYGSGAGNGGRIRVPSRKHKNRFKNFLKLFPWSGQEK